MAPYMTLWSSWVLLNSHFPSAKIQGPRETYDGYLGFNLASFQKGDITCLLLNIGLYWWSIMEPQEVKDQLKVQTIIDTRGIRLSTSPCGYPIGIVLKKDKGLCMCVIRA